MYTQWHYTSASQLLWLRLHTYTHTHHSFLHRALTIFFHTSSCASDHSEYYQPSGGGGCQLTYLAVFLVLELHPQRARKEPWDVPSFDYLVRSPLCAWGSHAYTHTYTYTCMYACSPHESLERLSSFNCTCCYSITIPNVGEGGTTIACRDNKHSHGIVIQLRSQWDTQHDRFIVHYRVLSFVIIFIDF